MDTTLFMKKINNLTLLVQIYVDYIISDSTNETLCEEFLSMMQREFEISMMGKLNYFLDLQIKQANNGRIINQSKYCKELLKKFNMDKCKEIVTPMISSTYVDQDESGVIIDIARYRGMTSSWLYLTASRPEQYLVFVYVLIINLFQKNLIYLISKGS
ncbi:uncharacterized protein LOC131605905 [Vicia villosa]|uniref:uncharacterized protein LOC131605905 n=1 Tax=Vicia villosa TaxID=3911 RepID=UPI00273C9080|nr:uncharacterized protein LOC131605905 [Vicia villosa]